MNIILGLQKILIRIGIFLLVTLPLGVFFDGWPASIVNSLFQASFFAVFLVMSIRPLSDVTGIIFLKRLVILRKGFGVFSASIIVGLMLQRILISPAAYFESLLSVSHYALFAHVADLAGLILLVTSNVFSQRLLRSNWKRIQRLSYVYFYAGGIYEAFALDSMFALYAILAITNITALAWLVKRL